MSDSKQTYSCAVKVQVALYPPGAPALVYDRKRLHTAHVTLDGSTKAEMGDDMKGYFKGTWTGKTWVIGARLGDRAW